MADTTHRTFLTRRLESMRRLTEDGAAVFLGAFTGGELAASLGIVTCGGCLARFQDVHTVLPHRRRGLAAHLLGVAAEWAQDRGCTRWVIVADEGSAAGRLYRSCGLTDTSTMPQAYMLL